MLLVRGNGGPVGTFDLISGAGDELAMIPCVVEGGIAQELAEAGGMFQGFRVDVRGSGRVARVELGEVPLHDRYFEGLALDTSQLLGRTPIVSGPYEQLPPDAAASEHRAEIDAWLREARADDLGARLCGSWSAAVSARRRLSPTRSITMGWQTASGRTCVSLAGESSPRG